MSGNYLYLSYIDITEAECPDEHSQLVEDGMLAIIASSKPVFGSFNGVDEFMLACGSVGLDAVNL